MKPVTIIGAGWAGLAAAIRLSEQGIPCEIIEASSAAGGRARGVQWQDTTIDNGQHLLIGAYQCWLDLLKTIDVDANSYLYRSPCQLNMQTLDQQHVIRFTVQAKAKPLHLLQAGLLARGFNFLEKTRFLHVLHNLYSSSIPPLKQSALEWLQSLKQSPKLIQQLWDPLCLAALTTSAEQASAQVFQQVMRDSFTPGKQHSDFLFARCDLSELFVKPALAYLAKKGVQIHYGHPIQSLKLENNLFTEAKSKQKQWALDDVIIACSAKAAQTLLQPLAPFKKTAEALACLKPEAITTIYLQYAANISLNAPLIGLNGCLSQWLFDRQFANQPGLIAVVISGNRAIADLDNQHIAKKVQQELGERYPHWPAASKVKVIREKYAAFRCDPHSQALRPANRTDIDNCYLAGDYTATNYPACLEGAARSGVNCANYIIRQRLASV